MNDSLHASRILIVEDEPINAKVLVDLLRPYYHLTIARDGVQALKRLLSGEVPDLALVDMMMPNMNGVELCRRMKADPLLEPIPIIFISSRSAEEDETQGLEAGAVDYITKPFKPMVVLARVETQIALRNASRSLAEQNHKLEELVEERTRELELAQEATVKALAALVEMRDNETGRHVLRTQRYVRLLAEALKQDPNFSHRLTALSIHLMYKSAPLHDIGKIGIPDSILRKPGKLTPDEFDIMKKHTEIGRKALESSLNQSGLQSEFLNYAIEIAGSHHERWDGSGYPEGLRGEEIPLSARLMALADFYDALTSARIYKRAMSHDEARTLILEGRERHFDPAVVDAFLKAENEFRRIGVELADPICAIASAESAA